MPRYRIETDEGLKMGCYEGSDEAAALDAYARDAGYESYADLIKVTGGEDAVAVLADPDESDEAPLR